jgi:hypothetical protein
MSLASMNYRCTTILLRGTTLLEIRPKSKEEISWAYRVQLKKGFCLLWRLSGEWRLAIKAETPAPHWGEVWIPEGLARVVRHIGRGGGWREASPAKERKRATKERKSARGGRSPVGRRGPGFRLLPPGRPQRRERARPGTPPEEPTNNRGFRVRNGLKILCLHSTSGLTLMPLSLTFRLRVCLH